MMMMMIIPQGNTARSLHWREGCPCHV